MVLQTDASQGLSKSTSATVWITLVVVALFVAVVLPRLRRRKDGPRETLGAFGASSGGTREELERLLTEIQDLSREQIAKLDTKIRMLNQLLLECDQKKRDLEDLIARTAGLPCVFGTRNRSSTPGVSSATARAVRLTASSVLTSTRYAAASVLGPPRASRRFENCVAAC